MEHLRDEFDPSRMDSVLRLLERHKVTAPRIERDARQCEDPKRPLRHDSRREGSPVLPYLHIKDAALLIEIDPDVFNGRNERSYRSANPVEHLGLILAQSIKKGSEVLA